jgi:hypothetical protein
MKIIKLFAGVVSALLLVAAVSCNKCPNSNCPLMNGDSISVNKGISIAYVKMDSLLLNYNAYKQTPFPCP